MSRHSASSRTSLLERWRHVRLDGERGLKRFVSIAEVRDPAVPLPPAHAAIGFCSSSLISAFRSLRAVPSPSRPSSFGSRACATWSARSSIPNRARERICVQHREEHEHLVALDHFRRVERIDEGAVPLERRAGCRSRSPIVPTKRIHEPARSRTARGLYPSW